jgi:hypothetical protein
MNGDGSINFRKYKKGKLLLQQIVNPPLDKGKIIGKETQCKSLQKIRDDNIIKFPTAKFIIGNSHKFA